MSGGHITDSMIEVLYGITNPARVTKAEVVIHAPGVGALKRLAFEPREQDRIRVDLDPSTIDLGPTVKLRAHCPTEGDTDWYTLGTPPLPTEEREKPVFRIGNVGPSSISLTATYLRNNGEVPDGSGVPITLWGPLFDRGCTAQATVDGRDVTLFNQYATPKQVHALLLYRDIGNREVASRYLEVQVRVSGPGFGRVAIARIALIE